MDILAFFTSSGVPATGLSPTIKIRRVSDNALLVNGSTMTEVGDGFYKYNFVTYDASVDYAIVCDGGVSLSGAERYTYAGSENTEVISGIENVNTNILGLSANNDQYYEWTEEYIEEVNMNVLALSASLVDISADIKRTLGLMHENIFIDQPSYDSDGNMIGARVRIYSNAGSVGTASNVIGTYQITSTPSGPGKFTDWKQVRL